MKNIRCKAVVSFVGLSAHISVIFDENGQQTEYPVSILELFLGDEWDATTLKGFEGDRELSIVFGSGKFFTIRKVRFWSEANLRFLEVCNGIAEDTRPEGLFNQRASALYQVDLTSTSPKWDFSPNQSWRIDRWDMWNGSAGGVAGGIWFPFALGTDQHAFCYPILVKVHQNRSGVETEVISLAEIPFRDGSWVGNFNVRGSGEFPVIGSFVPRTKKYGAGVTVFTCDESNPVFIPGLGAKPCGCKLLFGHRAEGRPPAIWIERARRARKGVRVTGAPAKASPSGDGAPAAETAPAPDAVTNFGTLAGGVLASLEALVATGGANGEPTTEAPTAPVAVDETAAPAPEPTSEPAPAAV